MEGKNKLAVIGAGLVAAGFGLSIVGSALIAPAVLMWTGSLLQKGADRVLGGMERHSRTVGTVAGTLQRSLGAATRAGIAEITKTGAAQSSSQEH